MKPVSSVKASAMMVSTLELKLKRNARSEIIYIQHKLFARLSMLFLLPRSTTGTWFVKLTHQSKDESHVMYS